MSPARTEPPKNRVITQCEYPSQCPTPRTDRGRETARHGGAGPTFAQAGGGCVCEAGAERPPPRPPTRGRPHGALVPRCHAASMPARQRHRGRRMEQSLPACPGPRARHRGQAFAGLAPAPRTRGRRHRAQPALRPGAPGPRARAPERGQGLVVYGLFNPAPARGAGVTASLVAWIFRSRPRAQGDAVGDGGPGHLTERPPRTGGTAPGPFSPHPPGARAPRAQRDGGQRRPVHFSQGERPPRTGGRPTPLKARTTRSPRTPGMRRTARRA